MILLNFLSHDTLVLHRDLNNLGLDFERHEAQIRKSNEVWTMNPERMPCVSTRPSSGGLLRALSVILPTQKGFTNLELDFEFLYTILNAKIS